MKTPVPEEGPASLPPSTPVPRRRRRGVGVAASLPALLSAAVLLVACAPPGGGGGTTSTTTPTNWATCPTPGAGQVRIATVVEGTGLAGFSQPEVVCVVVAQGASGLEALDARAARLGVPANRIGVSGLLCAIGGLPAAPACGESGPSGPEYWSYWVPDGSGGWSYAPVGPAFRSMQEGGVEGWRWVPGGASQAPVHVSTFSQLTN